MNLSTKRLARAAIVASIAALFATPAAANLVLNGSFETGIGAPAAGLSTSLGDGSTAITGWLITQSDHAGNIEWEGQGYSSLTTPAGSRFIDLTGNPDFQPRATIAQSFATQLGATYRLTFIAGVNNSNGAFAGPVGVQVGVGDHVQVFSDIESTHTGPNNVWTPETYDFTATSALTALSFLGSQGINYIGLDDVDVELVRAADPVTPVTPGTVPEPAAVGLFGLGLVAMGAQRRRARAAQVAALA